MGDILAFVLLIGLMFLPLWSAVFCLIVAGIIEGGWGSADSQG